MSRLVFHWVGARPVATGVLWGVLQAGLFYGGVLANTIRLHAPQLLLLALPLAAVFGYRLRDLDGSVKAFLVCQGVTWLIIVGILDIFSPEFRNVLLSSDPSDSAALAVVALVGVGILWFILGLVG